MCNIWKKSSSGQKELRVNEIEDIFADSLLSKLEWIQLSGGEPFLRKDIAEIVCVLLELHQNSMRTYQPMVCCLALLTIF
jgi:molybdenum cofactor biosynthesis enzyme MoaA